MAGFTPLCQQSLPLPLSISLNSLHPPSNQHSYLHLRSPCLPRSSLLPLSLHFKLHAMPSSKHGHHPSLTHAHTISIHSPWPSKPLFPVKYYINTKYGKVWYGYLVVKICNLMFLDIFLDFLKKHPFNLGGPPRLKVQMYTENLWKFAQCVLSFALWLIFFNKNEINWICKSSSKDFWGNFLRDGDGLKKTNTRWTYLNTSGVVTIRSQSQAFSGPFIKAHPKSSLSSKTWMLNTFLSYISLKIQQIVGGIADRRCLLTTPYEWC